MVSTDFRKNKPCDIEIQYHGQTHKFWVLNEGAVSTERALSAQTYLASYESIGGGKKLVDMLVQAMTFSQNNPPTPENYQKQRDLCVAAAMIAQDSLLFKDRAINYARIGSLFCVTEDELLVHPDDGYYTDTITQFKIDMSREVQELHAFFLSVGLEYMRAFVPTLNPVSPKTLMENQRKFLKLIAPKLQVKAKNGISTSPSSL